MAEKALFYVRFALWYSRRMNIFATENLAFLIVAVAWVLAWKGVALWKAARLSHKNWYIAILVLNTFGILEIFYIFFVASKYRVETAETADEPSTEEG